MPVNASNDNLGWLAPSFKLKDISGEIKSLDDLKGNNGTVIAFICNHCPYVIAIAERLSFEARELEKLSILIFLIKIEQTLVGAGLLGSHRTSITKGPKALQPKICDSPHSLLERCVRCVWMHGLAVSCEPLAP